jgi:hypothetical protein
MHQFASGPLGADVVGSEPPLSPETVGRAPGSSAFLDGSVTLKPIPTIPRPAPAPPPETPAADSRRLVVRLLGGEQLELATFDDREAAMAAAADLVAIFAAAEADGEWPEVEGRFLRPGSIASVDVLVAA